MRWTSLEVWTEEGRVLCVDSTFLLLSYWVRTVGAGQEVGRPVEMTAVVPLASDAIGLDQSGGDGRMRSGQMVDVFWKRTLRDLLMDQLWNVREKGKDQDDIKVFDLNT